MSDPRDDAFRALLDAVRAFNQHPSLDRRADVEAAAKRLAQMLEERLETSTNVWGKLKERR